MTDVQRLSTAERIAEVLRRARPRMGGEAGAMVDALLSPENLVIVSATLALWAGSHLFGIGEIVDVLLLVVGAFTIGWSIGDVARDLANFARYTLSASDEADLDRAAQCFAHAVVLAGVTTVMALLLRRSVRQIQATRGASVAEAMRPRSPGLPRVGADPDAGRLWSRPGIRSSPSLAAGEGSTSAFGEVTLSSLGSATEQALVRAHELVHRFLTPRFGVLRSFRVRLAMSGYTRSMLLQFLEEAMAETVAQLRVNGLSGLLTGVRFPVANGYMSLQALMSEGAAIGTVVAETQLFSVQFLPANAEVRPDDACYASPR